MRGDGDFELPVVRCQFKDEDESYLNEITQTSVHILHRLLLTVFVQIQGISTIALKLHVPGFSKVRILRPGREPYCATDLMFQFPFPFPDSSQFARLLSKLRDLRTDHVGGKIGGSIQDCCVVTGKQGR